VSELPDAKIEVTAKHYDPETNRVELEIYFPPAFDKWVGTRVENRTKREWVPIGMALTATLQGGIDRREETLWLIAKLCRRFGGR
jgi:hypothetical protein